MTNLEKLRTAALAVLLTATAVRAAEVKEEKHGYLRLVQDRFQPECEFLLKSDATGWSIDSLTAQGRSELALHAEYRVDGALMKATVTLGNGVHSKKATVEVTGAKARVTRANEKPQEFQIQKGVIVTSARDWT